MVKQEETPNLVSSRPGATGNHSGYWSTEHFYAARELHVLWNAQYFRPVVF